MSYLAPASRAIVAPAFDRASTTRAAVASHSYLREVQAVLADRGRAVPATPSLPAPGAAELSRTSALPASLRGPVAGLEAAIDAAASRVGRIPLRELQAELAEVDAANAAYPGRVAHAPTVDGPALPTGGHVKLPTQISQLDGLRLQPATQHAIAEDPAAALLVAAALDRYLPQVSAAAGSAPQQAGTAAAGCDLVDQSPYLCVGSNADNTYGGDEMLLLDLGGNNTYNGGAGSAPFLPAGAPSSAATVPVSVNVDMGGGHDAYLAPVSSLASDQSGSHPGLVMGEGGAVFGGLGFSVNLSGDDSYLATALPPPPPTPTAPAPYTLAVAQGAGVSGYGFLFDGGGNDRYALDEPQLQDVAGRFDGAAQGAVFGIDGAAALIDAGGGNDQYVVNAGGETTNGRRFMFSTINAQGATQGDGTAAVLVDDGGTDSFALTGASQDAILEHSFDTAYYQVAAQGYGAIGAGLLLEGPGSHSYHYDLDMEGGGDGLFEIAGQGAAGQAGYGILQDAGGPNVYDMQSVIRHQETRTVDDGCGCTSASVHIDGHAGDDPQTNPLDSTYILWPEWVIGQGAGANGVGLLDNAGAATYNLVATATMDVTLADQLTAPTASANLYLQGFDGPIAYGQGAVNLGYPDETQTAGLLVNQAGHATYRFLTGDAVHASATSLHGPTPVVHAHTGFQQMVAAQGASAWEANPPNGDVGALLDLGGPGDTFSATQDTSAVTSPDTGHAVSPGGFWAALAGAGDGGLLVAAGASPVVVASPANGVCPGSGMRGTQAWFDCGYYNEDQTGADLDHQTVDYLAGLGYGVGHGGGFLPNAPPAAAPALALSAPSTVGDGEAAPVTVGLAGPSGAPLAGRVVHVSLQAELPLTVALSPSAPVSSGNQWITVGETTLTTDAAGTARGLVPAALTEITGYAPSQLRFDRYRLVATFDGDAGITPHHVASAITITDTVPVVTPEFPLAPLALLVVVLPAGIIATRRRRA